MKKKILLIGGAGFIGSHLNEKLLKLGHEVVVIDKKNKDFGKEKPDIVYHLAGAINLRKGESDPGIERAKIVCQFCKENKVKKLIFFSSGGAILYNLESENCSSDNS
jgi:nucleoside-diphosphate-sugar epimerase